MQVAVIGAGYVGLVTAAGLAASGHRVRVGEIDPEKVAVLDAGGIPIHEAGLDQLVRQGLDSGSLSFHTDNTEAVKGAEVVLLALPTPPADDGSADLSMIEAALRQVAPALDNGVVVVTKSTVPVGSVSRFQRVLDELGVDARVASNPEFLREGSAVGDFFHPDRIVIGSNDEQATRTLTDMYDTIDAPVLVTDPASAEMIKYASNAYLATRITFANALANVCEYVGADAAKVLEGMGRDRRIGSHFLNPGPGYGGSCFPKDTRALVAIADEAGYDFSLLKGVIEVNELQLTRTVGKVLEELGATANPRVGLWGLAFKAGTDDIRESPAMKIASLLIESGITVTAYDPAVPAAVMASIVRAPDAIGAARGADVLVVATEWPEFSEVDLASVRDAMRGSSIVDARNMLDPDSVRGLGMSYRGVGR